MTAIAAKAICFAIFLCVQNRTALACEVVEGIEMLFEQGCAQCQSRPWGNQTHQSAGQIVAAIIVWEY